MFGLFTTPNCGPLNAQMQGDQNFVLAVKAEANIATYEALIAMQSYLSAQSSVIDAKTTVLKLKIEAQKAKMEARGEASESTTHISLDSRSLESTRVKLAKQVDDESQNARFNPVVIFDGKLTVIEPKDFPDGQKKLFARIRTTFRYNCEEIIRQLKEINNYSLVAFESEELVGLVLGDKETSVMDDEARTPSTGYSISDIYTFPFLTATSDNIKLMLLLGAMKKTKDMGMKYFSFEFESGNFFMGKFSPKKENNYFRDLENIAKKCNVIILKGSVEIINSSIQSTLFEHVSYDVRNFEYEKAQ